MAPGRRGSRRARMFDKHSLPFWSKSATIRLSNNTQSTSIEIQDEGTGISAEKLLAIQGQRSGVGISGMRERVRHLNGTLNI